LHLSPTPRLFHSFSFSSPHFFQGLPCIVLLLLRPRQPFVASTYPTPQLVTFTDIPTEHCLVLPRLQYTLVQLESRRSPHCPSDLPHRFPESNARFHPHLQ
jgi:hypothetical protein